MDPYREMLSGAGAGNCPACGASVVWPAGATTDVCACGARYATALAKPRTPLEPRIERFGPWAGKAAALGASMVGVALAVAGGALSIVAVPIALAVGVTSRRRPLP